MRLRAILNDGEVMLFSQGLKDAREQLLWSDS
jgi:hypothetical protein